MYHGTSKNLELTSESELLGIREDTQACVCDSNEVCQSLERYSELKSSDIPMQ